MNLTAIKLLTLYWIILISLLACQHVEDVKKEKINYAIDQGFLEQPVDTSLWLRETRGIRAIQEDQFGNIWFSSTDFLAKFDGKEIVYFTAEDGFDLPVQMHLKEDQIIFENGEKLYWFMQDSVHSSFIKDFQLSTISLDLDTALYIPQKINFADTSLQIPGFYQITKTHTSFTPYPIDPASNYKFLYLPTTKALLSQDGTQWWGTMEKVFGYQDNSFKILGRSDLGREKDERQMGIRGIFIDEANQLWIADNGAGVFIYDGVEVINLTQELKLDAGDADGPTLDRAFSIGQDSEGNIWIGTVYSGVWKFDPGTNKIENFDKEDGLESDQIWTIYKSKKGPLLFGAEFPGAVYVFNGASFERRF